MTLFTGSQAIGDKLTHITNGRIKLEDAGFDWKILGPDCNSYSDHEVKYVASVCDQDAFGFSGQKCSSQSILFAHDSWLKRGLLHHFKIASAKRNFQDLSIGPVMTWNNERIESHLNRVLSIPKSQLVFGGKPLLDKHSVPKQ